MGKLNCDSKTNYGPIRSDLYILGGGCVQGRGKGQRLMSIFAVIDYIWLATYQSKIYEK